MFKFIRGYLVKKRIAFIDSIRSDVYDAAEIPSILSLVHRYVDIPSVIKYFTTRCGLSTQVLSHYQNAEQLIETLVAFNEEASTNDGIISTNTKQLLRTKPIVGLPLIDFLTDNKGNVIIYQDYMEVMFNELEKLVIRLNDENTDVEYLSLKLHSFCFDIVEFFYAVMIATHKGMR